MITAETLFVVCDQAAVHGLTEETLQTLRKNWPDLHFTLCSEDDVPARLSPAIESENFNLYLVSNASHCVAFTSQLDAASGIVLAAVEAD
jgi:hypothetical protein